MTQKTVNLRHMQSDEPNGETGHEEFLRQVETGLLLALREKGLLTVMQHRHAETWLDQQRNQRRR